MLDRVKTDFLYFLIYDIYLYYTLLHVKTAIDRAKRLSGYADVRRLLLKFQVSIYICEAFLLGRSTSLRYELFFVPLPNPQVCRRLRILPYRRSL